MKTITLHPSRIGCPSIPGTMKGMMLSIPGVKNVVVRYEDRSLDVTLDETKVSPEGIIKKIGQETGLTLEIGESGGSKPGSAAEICPM